MVFRTFDRLAFVAMEAVEGVNAFDIGGSATAADAVEMANAPVAADYIETIEPTFSITNRVYDRDPTRRSITPAPKTEGRWPFSRVRRSRSASGWSFLERALLERRLPFPGGQNSLLAAGWSNMNSRVSPRRRQSP